MSIESLRILIVDDEDIVQETLSAFIEELGHQADIAPDGTSGLQAIQQAAYDLALIDVRMPGIDGLDLLEKARALRPDMPMIIMSGHGDPLMSEQAQKMGARDFLIKPVRLAELIKILDQVGSA